MTVGCVQAFGKCPESFFEETGAKPSGRGEGSHTTSTNLPHQQQQRTTVSANCPRDSGRYGLTFFCFVWLSASQIADLQEARRQQHDLKERLLGRKPPSSLDIDSTVAPLPAVVSKAVPTARRAHALGEERTGKER